MEVLRPTSLDEALAMRAEQPDATVLQGGTDVMVEINFGRLDPVAVLDLSEVPELRGVQHADGRVRIGAGVTYADLMAGDVAAALPATVADLLAGT